MHWTSNVSLYAFWWDLGQRDSAHIPATVQRIYTPPKYSTKNIYTTKRKMFLLLGLQPQSPTPQPNPTPQLPTKPNPLSRLKVEATDPKLE